MPRKKSIQPVTGTAPSDPSRASCAIVPPGASAAEFAVELAAAREQDERRYERLKQQARALSRSYAEWPGLDNEDAWLERQFQAQADYTSGAFLIERLGGERFLDPDLFAVLLSLRQRILLDLDVQQAHETMLVDLAILAYYNALRVQGWVGNLALVLDAQAFGGESPVIEVTSGRRNKRAGRLLAEESVRRMNEALLPLLDRANRMLIRNLQAVITLRQVPVPSVAIGQVNVGAQQTNVVAGAPEDARSLSELTESRRPRPGGSAPNIAIDGRDTNVPPDARPVV